VVRWGLLSPRLPDQHDQNAEFGEPPITVYVGQGFFVAVNFWLTSTTAIHNHSFSGAFQVLGGSSLETTFRFDCKRRVNAHMALGDVVEVERRVLKVGATREIRAGATIHSLFHLEHLSATVVVRTGRDLGAAPQLNYYRPRVALDPMFEPADLRRRKQLLNLLAKSSPKRLVPACLAFVRGADLVSRFVVLRHCAALLSPEEGDALLDRARRIDPTLLALVTEVVEGDRREAFLIRRRAPITNSELRFFLAVLLNVRGRAEALSIVEKQFPKRDPTITVLAWIRALAASPGPTDGGPSALGFPIDEVTLAVLEGALRERSPDEVAQIVETVTGRAVSRRERSELVQLRRALEHSEIFSYLLQGA
jgi:hypothetical protein